MPREAFRASDLPLNEENLSHCQLNFLDLFCVFFDCNYRNQFFKWMGMPQTQIMSFCEMLTRRGPNSSWLRPYSIKSLACVRLTPSAGRPFLQKIFKLSKRESECCDSFDLSKISDLLDMTIASTAGMRYFSWLSCSMTFFQKQKLWVGRVWWPDLLQVISWWTYKFADFPCYKGPKRNLDQETPFVSTRELYGASIFDTTFSILVLSQVLAQGQSESLSDHSCIALRIGSRRCVAAQNYWVKSCLTFEICPNASSSHVQVSFNYLPPREHETRCASCLALPHSYRLQIVRVSKASCSSECSWGSARKSWQL